MKNILILMIGLMAYSCQNKETKNLSPETKEVMVDKEVTLDQKTEEHANEQIGDTIFLNFKNKQDSYVAQGAIDSVHNRIYIKFRNEFPVELNAKITPLPNKSAANIRFNQILFPDKTADGPFGTTLKRKLKQKGDYILVVGHSQMAENPYTGKFQVELQNTKE